MNTAKKINDQYFLIQEIAKTQAALNEIKAEVRESVHTVRSSLQNLHDSSTDERDLKFKIQFYARESQKLEMMQRSLRAHKEGTHGLCCGCGDRIGDRRLAVVPEAIRCISCQEYLDHSEKITKLLKLSGAA